MLKNYSANSQTSQTELLSLLKKVSRSFYLSIRILPQKSRAPVCIAYLLARLADSIADSASQEFSNKQQLLNTFIYLLNHQLLAESKDFISQALKLVSVREEQELIDQLPAILTQLNKLSAAEIHLTQKVVATLVSGMQKDMQLFNQKNSITALPDDEALDDYIYRVAGCVGEFWTEILDLHYGKSLAWDSQSQIRFGINFGKALQLTNILRDIQKDAAMGRCYLPASALKKQNLTVQEFISASHQHLAQPIIKEYLAQCLTYYLDAEFYLLATPQTQLRLRMAAFWPIAIGLKTLRLIADNNKPQAAKVQRRWVYQLLLLSPFILASNRFTHFYITHLRRQIVL